MLSLSDTPLGPQANVESQPSSCPPEHQHQSRCPQSRADFHAAEDAYYRDPANDTLLQFQPSQPFMSIQEHGRKIMEKEREQRQKKELDERLASDPVFAENYRLSRLMEFEYVFGNHIEELDSNCSEEPVLTNWPQRSRHVTPPMLSSPLLHAATPADSDSGSGGSTPRTLGRPSVGCWPCSSKAEPLNSHSDHRPNSHLGEPNSVPQPVWQRLWSFVCALPGNVWRGCRKVWDSICAWCHRCLVGDKKSR
ncbi:unnamed protein product [Vitrella brassicaformis CCMP3155]|uniref:Uncharacterized protein n=1 Tax=Vitrella brassicaformis (strain CCMP3155) TaxID=1169540 RepID=A0A0G4F3T1_VITBC|nr:unnamed protein product [Vitrella brassicaformis CCMP3155]|eukprot:CEM06883.1 unnamed protein product [Vitrella brassicaformis CCMP3155]